jgi:hypothetical protein
MERNDRGYINVQHTVWCGTCPHWEQWAEPTKRAMGRAAKGEGWRMTRLEGWRCPRCVKDNRTEKETLDD